MTHRRDVALALCWWMLNWEGHMGTSETVRVVHLVRAIGPTSGPWNNVYGNERRLAPGISFPPVAVDRRWGSGGFRRTLCGEKQRRYLSAGPLSALGYILALARRSRRRGRTFVLHVHNPVLALVAVMAKGLNPSIRIVNTQRNDWRFFKPHQKLGLRLLAWLSDRYVLCGNALARTMPRPLKQRLEAGGRLSAIPNGINPRQLATYTRPPSGTDGPGEVRALVVARMVPQKNCKFVLELLARSPSIDRLIWFGDGPERAELEQEIVRLGISDRIELRGRRPRSEVLKSLASESLYIAASKWEGLSVADLEAVALGCWPIMSDIPQREEIAEALDIPLYPLNDIAEWTSGIESFLALPAQTRLGMRERMMRRAREVFDLDVTVTSYIKLYAGLLSPAEPQSPSVASTAT